MEDVRPKNRKARRIAASYERRGEYLSDQQLAERLSVSRQTIWRWLRADPLFPRPHKFSAGCTR